MNDLEEFFQRYKSRISAKQVHWLLFFLILGLGFFARTWEFRSLPPGLNPDEASIGVDAFSLLHYGIDRNGISFPVQFISWGSGQNALYGYILIPFIAAMGLTPFTIRLPMLLSGIATLPLLYYVAKETLNKDFGLLSMFFLAISPWHILLSRWGLEANIFPFVFLAGYACLLGIKKNDKWIIPACIFWGLCFYAYGTAYAMIPVFMICTITILIQHKLVAPKSFITGLLAFIALATPIGLFVLVNTFQMNSIQLGPVTIPRFPVQARFEATTIFSATNQIQTVWNNLWVAVDLLITQSDGLPYNAIDPYGYFYKVTFPFELIGIALLIVGLKSEKHIENKLLIAWIGASILIPIIQPVNINRFNIIFIPLILCIAFSIYWMSAHYKTVLVVSVLGLLAGFICFTINYHEKAYRQQVSLEFHDGILPALTFAQGIGNTPICVSDNSNPYIFALFSEPTNPIDYLNTVKYVNPKGPVRVVRSFGRYTFGWNNCHESPVPIYILIAGSAPPNEPSGYTYNVKSFDSYVVYYPSH